MTDTELPTDLPADLAAVAVRVIGGRGDVLALELAPDHLQPLLDRLDWEIDDDRVTCRLVLGAACTTAARTVEQFVAAMQLPYAASRGWADLLDHLGDRAVNRREYVVVADAADLLRHEDPGLWHRLVRDLAAGPFCLGGGWTTLVLVDDAYSWSCSRFGSAVGAERAARDLPEHAARRW
ncbi:barstar family protein [Virgisporangium ochraceum]|uniref:Barstar (barnase inhibitor) domain-containing protein n=1 Tax=Virgisporangium ochraceum TaxID=65505 RepID=A0A8J4EDW3_9ACTN|nr:barstar family protein [Virgisporangium ochraceum]GIJ71096.1 hypothetical protein Voc01_060130 [Virgisporangium ochraceum]